MIDTLAAICLTLSALGLALSYSMGGFIHWLLAFGLTVVLSRFLPNLRRYRRLRAGAAADPVPESGGYAVPQRQAGRVVMQGMSLPALPQPAAVGSPVVDRLMTLRVL